MFLRNYWYVAAWADEVSRDPVGFILLNEPIVVFRSTDGTPVALEDRCAHRRLPLSKGHVIEDTIVCGYHGLAYDCRGTCVHIPGQSPVPAWARVKSYPVVERYGCIWIWMGDHERADPSLIYDLHWGDPPGWGEKNRLHAKAHYQLINDNLCDLSHLGYVHAGNVGTTALAENGEVETEVEGNIVRVSRWTIDKAPPSSYAATAGFTGNIDRWQITEFTPPAFFKLNFGAVAAGPGRNARTSPNRWAYQVCQWATPETEKSSHWFWAITEDFGPGVVDRSSAPPFYQLMHTIVSEDFATIEAQQRSIDLNPAAPNGIIDADSGVIEARRIIARLLRDEIGADEEKRPATHRRPGEPAARTAAEKA